MSRGRNPFTSSVTPSTVEPSMVSSTIGIDATNTTLAATFPGLFAITTFTSLGDIVLPIAFAFGFAARRIAASD